METAPQIPYLVPPWQHQLEAIRLATVPEPRSFALFMEPGTGKTGTEINILRHLYVSHGRVLRTVIFAPISVVRNWEREFSIHSKLSAMVHVLLGPGAKRVALLEQLMLEEPAIVVTNYESLSMDGVLRALEAFGVEVLVFDESQRMKNAKAKRTKAAIKLADRVFYKYLLSGSPILNSPMDIFAQYRILDGGETFGDNFFVFRKNYFYDKNSGMPSHKYFPDWQPQEGLAKIFNEKIYSKAYRVLKKDCLDLPSFVKTRAYVTMGPAQAKLYNSMFRSWVAYLHDKAFVATIALTKALRLQQITSGFCVDEDGGVMVFDENPRIQVLEELLEQLTPDHKVIVWACFRPNYGAIETVCQKLGIRCAKLVGGMTDKERERDLEAFQKDPGVRVMIANQGAGGIGVNMVEASYAIYFSRNYSLEQDLQSEARNYRGGSEMHQKVTRIDLVCQDTIDEVVLEALWNKQDVAEAIMKWKK